MSEAELVPDGRGDSSAVAVECELRGVRLSDHKEQVAVAVVGPRDRRDVPSVLLFVGAGDAHTLSHELRGEETPRSQALCLVGIHR